MIQPDGRIQRVTDPVLEKIKARKEEERKAREEAKESSIKQSIEQRYEEIESQKPKTFKDLDDIAQKSKYKHLRKIGGDDADAEYETEYKKAHPKTKGTLSPRVTKIQEYRKTLETLQAEVASLKKPTNIGRLTVRERQSIAKQIAAKEQEINDLKTEIALEEQFLRAQKAPIQDWEAPELDEAELEKRKVDYLTPPERKNFALHIESGIMKQKPGEKEHLYDTQKSYTAIKGKGWGVYVMDPNGQFYAGPHVIGQFHHSSFLSGGAIAGAGELKVGSGRLKEINNKSGHYKPGLYQIVQTLMQLDKDGVDLSTVDLTTANITPAGNGKASQFLAKNRGILDANEANSEDKVSVNTKNNELKALGLYSMNGAWYTLNHKLSEEDLKIYEEIIANGGSEKLLEEGFVLEQGEWKNSEGKSQSAQRLRDALIGEVEEVDEDERYESIVDDLVEEIGREEIIELLKDKMEGLKWDGLQWLQGDEEIEKADVGRAIEEVKNAEAE